MPLPKVGISPESPDALQTEIERLHQELDRMKESSFNTIRDLKVKHENEIAALVRAHASELEELSAKTVTAEKEQQEKLQKLTAKAIEDALRSSRAEWRKDTDSQLAALRETLEKEGAEATRLALKTARQEWEGDQEAELRTRLAEASEKWAEAERERMIKFKVDIVHEKSLEWAEREEYWKQQLARLDPTRQTGKPAPRKGMFSGFKKSRDEPIIQHSELREARRPLLLTTLVAIFLFVAAGYLFAPQWQPIVRSTAAPVLNQNDGPWKDTLFIVAPWLRPLPGDQ